ncbi:PH domain-containing protein [Rubrobacter calidifluminis]|uniref:PH domain-containing protein n=1 Tax=Rubrobacter calidifluminis TaxID=1392640 RepID=UPI00235FED77|nr:PH domain-containing protein [Rubrobacter calidifluminis]
MHHLHPSAMLFEAARHVRNWIGVLFGGGTAALAGGHLPAHVVLTAGTLVLLSGSVAWGFLSWRATTYEVSGDSFLLRRGVLSKNEMTIPLQRIQSVDVVQGVPQRILGVVEVRVETAGGGSRSPEAVLPALSRDAAEALRRELEGPGTADEGRPPARILARLSTRELLLAGATSGQIGVALSLIGVVWQAADNFLPQDLTLRLAERFAPHSAVGWASLALAAGLLAWLLSIGGTVLAYTGFTLSREGEILRIRRGLLERNEAALPVSRIQAVRIVEGVLRQPLGLATLRVESAGYGKDAGVSTTLFPLLPRSRAHEVLLAAVPEFAADPALRRPPDRARRRYAIRSALPAAALAAALIFLFTTLADAGPPGFLPVLVVPPALLYGLLSHRDTGWAISGDRLVLRTRRLSRTTTIIPLRCLQSRSVVQNPLQRRARLAGFRVSIASGRGRVHTTITDLDAASAHTLLVRTGSPA